MYRFLRLTPAACALFLASAGLAGATNGAALHVDPAHSVATFTIKHLAITNVQGTMKIVTVEMPLRPNSTIPASVDAVIDVRTVNTADAKRDDDLRSADWFDVQHYPSMHFVSERIVPTSAPNAFQAVGMLTFHGVTREVALDVAFQGDIRDEHGAHHFGYVATTTLDRRDFGLDALKSTPGGALLVGTNVAVTIDLDMVDAAISAHRPDGSPQ